MTVYLSTLFVINYKPYIKVIHQSCPYVPLMPTTIGVLTPPLLFICTLKALV